MQDKIHTQTRLLSYSELIAQMIESRINLKLHLNRGRAICAEAFIYSTNILPNSHVPPVANNVASAYKKLIDWEIEEERLRKKITQITMLLNSWWFTSLLTFDQLV